MNSVIYHSNYKPLTTYAGGYVSSTDYYAYYYTYLTGSTTINGRTAGLYYGPGDDYNGVRYSGNYLNWIFWSATEAERNSLPQQTRIQAARQVMTFLVNNITGVRFGLMKLNYDHGGNIVAPCGSNLTTLSNAINGILATTWTPLSETMVEAWLYFSGGSSYYNSGTYTTPIQYWCQRNFVILVTDGEPTYDYTFPSWVLPGIAGHYDTTPKSGNNGYPYYLDGVAWYLNNHDARSNLSGMQNVSTYTIGFNIDHPYLQATAAKGGGQYFTASNTEQLSDVFQTVLGDIIQRSFSFTSPTVPAIRAIADNVLYLTSFEPSTKPVWKGDVTAFRLQEDGTLAVDADLNPDRNFVIWDASDQLRTISSDSRKIYTVIGGPATEEFKTTNSNLTRDVLAVSTDADRNNLISHIRGKDTYDMDPKDGNTTNDRLSKLGDIFHSDPVIVGSPNPNFEDDGFTDFYLAKKDREKVIIAGANDGMLHAFNATTGNEEWAFIPNSLLKTLKTMVTTHTYYVDSSPKVADVWIDYNGDNTKTTNEWRTVLVNGLRKGGSDVVLGSDGFSYICIKDHTAVAGNRPITGASWATYWAQQGTRGGTSWVTGTGYFAKWRYFALDITDTLNPQYLWEFPNSNDAATLAKVGQSWSEPAIGRVKVGGSEKWVAFIGGGFDPQETRTTPASIGKAFFVIDIRTGGIIKEFSGLTGMNYSFAAPPKAVDANSDGFVDKVYIGDLGGQMWVFDISNSDPNAWGGKILFQAPISSSEKHSIYYQPAVALDRSGKPWVYFGTGDREKPKDFTNQNERFYAVKDDGSGTYPRTETNNTLSNVTSSNTFNQVQEPLKGWFITLSKSGNSLEKVLAKPAVFNQLVYFTTYTYIESADPCSIGATAKAYVVEYLSGGGALTVDALSDLSGPASDRSKIIGSNAGIPSPPVISVDMKGKATVTIMTTTGQVISQEAFSPLSSKTPLYWREVIP
jgi:type IV pilus assembly protein PilY1